MTLLVFIAILSIMIVVHEFAHFYQARRLGIRVERFALGFGPKLLSRKKDETEYVLGLIPFGGYVKLAGDSWQELKGERYEFLSRSPQDRAKVIFAGPLLNYLLAFLCFWIVNIIGYPNLTSKVGDVMEGYPAQAAGVLKGDKIIAIDGRQVKYWQELQDIVRKKKTTVVELEILRQRKQLKLSLALRQEEIRNILGARQKVNLIGVRPEGESVLVRHNIFSGFIFAGKNLWDITVLTYTALGRIVTGGLSLKESVTGPLGMFIITSQVVSLGFSAVLHFMAILSASLALFNFLPLPALDGGHLFLLGIEKIRGRHLAENIEEKISQAGIAFLIGLAVFVFLNDCARFGIWDRIGDILAKVIR